MKEALENQAWEELERLWGEHDERVEQLAREYPPERKSKPRIVPLWRYAAAATVAGLLAVGAWLWVGKPAEDVTLLAENRMAGEFHHDNDTPAATITITKRTLNPQPSTLNPQPSPLTPHPSPLTPSKPSLPSSTAETEPQRETVGLRHDNDNDSLRYDNENRVRPSVVEEHSLALVEEVVRVDFLAEETPSRPDPVKMWSDHKPNIIEQLAQGFQRRRENRRMIRDGILAEKM